ncbi:glycosyltransferase family 4 protein [Rhodococcus opacus]|uniref:glycosyltransferase family 4 protein n=1 Tax=Rhodococcus opacus TaxID=37919 RepID=UPI001C45D3E0|nr:glycosyltransferase [Rhodococcus opacus]MBV6760643.1 glycosyltransferase [Rhodococcus opacus]
MSSEVARDIEGLGIRGVPVTTYRTRLGVFANTPKLLVNSFRLRRFIVKNDIRIVISAMDSIWQSVAVRAYIPANVTYIASVHDATNHPGDEHIVKTFCRRLDLGRADMILTFSESVAMLVSETSNVPVRSTILAASGSSDAVARKRPARDRYVLGFFGRIVEYKGLDLLLEALDHLRETGVDVVLEIHGDGDIGDLKTRYPSERIVWNIGWIPEASVNSTIRRMDLVVLPYREASQSGVMTVAMAEGVPVVVTPVGALPDQVNHSGAGIVATGVNSASIASAIRKVIDDGDLYESLSQAALYSARASFSWKRVVDDIDGYLMEMVDCGRL